MPAKRVKDGTYYKVCSWDNTSAQVVGDWKLEYEVGKTTRAKIGGVFVFRTLEEAEAFAGTNNLIYRGEGRICWKQDRRVNLGYLPSRLKKLNYKKLYTIACPPGTICCKEFTPKGRVYWNGD